METVETKGKNSIKRKPRGRKIKRVEKPKNKAPEITRTGRRIGYMRVSTEKQDMALQYDALIAADVLPEDIFKDTISGSKFSRSGLDSCLKFMVAGDTLCVWKLDRLSRKLVDMLSLLQSLDDRGVRFVSLTQNIDTQTPTGRAMIQMIGLFAELERETIRERVKAGIQAKRGERRWGRKPTTDYKEEDVVCLLRKNMTHRAIAAQLGISKATVQRVNEKMKGKKSV